MIAATVNLPTMLGAAVRTPEIVWSAIAPQVILMVGGVLLLSVMSLFKDHLHRHVCTLWTVATALAAIIATVPLWGRVGNPAEGIQSVMAGAVGLDRFGLFLIATIAIGVILAAMFADGYLSREGLDAPELFVLLLLSASGGATMATANDLIVLFIGLEILSISAYVMAAMHARRLSSQEAGFKYLILGSFSSAVFLYGIALTYGATGSTNLVRIQEFLSQRVLTQDGLLLGGLALMLVGLGFKVAAVPFHMWAPDVYQGSPTPVSAFMAAAIKTAGFAGLLRVFPVAMVAAKAQWRPMVMVLAVLSLTVGAVLAIVQTNVKRMLAYSSIAHAGFVLVAVAAASRRGVSTALFYMLVYTFMVAGSFGVATIVGRRGDAAHALDDYRGLSRRQPVLAFAFLILLLAQAGVPLTGGFTAKLYVISAAAGSHDWWLAVVAMVASVISAYIYLRIVMAMYLDPAPEGDAESAIGRIPWATGAALGLAVGATLLLGMYPGPFNHLAETAVAGFRIFGG